MNLKRMKYLALILLIFFPVSVQAGNNHTVNIHLKNLGTVLEDVRFDLYKVGTMNGIFPVTDSQYHTGTLTGEAYKLDRTAKKISGMLSGNADRTGSTDKNGFLCFDGLESGVYLIRKVKSDDYGQISPFLIWLPYYENGTEYTSLDVEPKSSEQESNTETLSPTCTSFPEHFVQNETISPAHPVKTGDNTRFMQDTALLILSLTVCAALLYLKKGGRKL